MKLRLNATTEMYLDKLNSCREVVVFGASGCAEEFWKKLHLEGNVKYFVDNRYRELTEGFHACPVYSPERIKECDDSSMLLIASQYWREILEQVKKIGFRGEVYVANARVIQCANNKLRKACSLPEKVKKFEENRERLKTILADEISRGLVEKIYLKRLGDEVDYYDLFTDHQYFQKDIVTCDENAVFIDGGSFNGEDIRRFIDFSGNKYSEIHAFELDRINFDKIDKTSFGSKVFFHNYGLWNEDVEIPYNSNADSSALDSGLNSGDTAQCIALDNFLQNKPVSFIKMDIEGAERQALMGCRNIIKTYHPQLAICVYHRPEDIWEIPDLIRSFWSGYKIYLRHHSEFYWETVVYAVP